MLTEEEAKEKLCCGPMDVGMRLVIHGVVGDTRYCAGSACMAWRWKELSHSDGRCAHPPKPAMEFDGKYRGYCGLASKP